MAENLKFAKFLRKYFLSKPIIDSKKCIKCGVCVKACPVDALNFKLDEKPPIYDYNKCIRCYCCQEMCPQSAIYVKSHLLMKFRR